MHDTLSLRLAYPRKRDSIRRDAFLLRAKLGLEKTLNFPILHFIENVLPKIDSSFFLEVEEDENMPGIQAEYLPTENVIRVRQSVYDAAAAGFWWARFTLAHELGHYYYHDERSVRYAVLDLGQRMPPDFDPERQANAFAAELLVPINLIEGMSIKQIANDCSVSYTVAKRQLFALSRIRKRQEKKRQVKKKKRSSLLSSTADRHKQSHPL